MPEQHRQPEARPAGLTASWDEAVAGAGRHVCASHCLSATRCLIIEVTRALADLDPLIAQVDAPQLRDIIAGFTTSMHL